jgi:hypothetical protein
MAPYAKWAPVGRLPTQSRTQNRPTSTHSPTETRTYTAHIGRPVFGSAGVVCHEAVCPRQLRSDASSGQHDHRDETLGVVKAANCRADASDGGVVRLRDPVGELPFDRGFDGRFVVTDRPCQLHERFEPGSRCVREPVVERPEAAISGMDMMSRSSYFT